MNVNLLVDALVRQTTVLIAQLATSAGARATLAHTANQVFLDLVAELKAQGLGNKVIADMFGLTLRGYYHKVARLSESTTERGRSLWEALYSFIQERDTVARSELFERFQRDEEMKVRGVLSDLVDSGLVFRAGRGDATVYRAAKADELPLDKNGTDDVHLANWCWIAIYRNGPISLDELATHVPAEGALLSRALQALEAQGQIRTEQVDGVTRYSSDACVIPLGDPKGWEAAVFDHYQAMVTAICAKLALGQRRAVRGEWVGGSTFGFEIWDNHPERESVLELLQEMRDRVGAVRARVTEYNKANAPGTGALKVVTYVGQAVLGLDDEKEGDDS
jgi:predicted transcriptional regulator